MNSIFEAMMLICFGVAWPASIYKSWTSRTTAGKSLVFLLIVEAGYIAGLIHKIVYNRDAVLVLYLLNGVMVFIDILLYCRNRREQLRAKQNA